MSLLARFQRDINRLIDQDRNTRKRGLLKLLEELPWEAKIPQDALELQDLLKQMLPHLSSLIADSMEKCRELSLQLLHKTVDFIEPSEMIATCLDPLCVRIDDLPFQEPAEEIRLLIVCLFAYIIAKVTPLHIPEDKLHRLIHALTVVITDSFPSVKVEATSVLMKVMRSSSLIRMNYKELLKNLLQNAFHQHSKVRAISLKVTHSFPN